MGKTTGFLEWQRELPAKRSVTERLRDWQELYLERSAEAAARQGGRCMDCGIPFCQQGCPLGNHIPDWNDSIYRGRWQEAYARLSATNNFPEITGRVCPAPCEGACVLAANGDAVTIEQNEKEIIERAFAQGWVQPEPPRHRTGRHVAVVGSGPAGLAAAAQLNAIGHQVTVFEAADRIGGLLRYGIPDFKLEKAVIDRRVHVMESEGIEFITNADVGTSPRWNELQRNHDALLIAIGARRPRDLQVPGRELKNVHFAMDYLTGQNQLVAGDHAGSPPIDAAGKKVVILGGGDTGADCLGTALRQGAEAVHQIELLPRPPKTRSANNPWPQWPVIDRSSTSHEEGGLRDFAVLTKQLSGQSGQLTTLHAVRVDVNMELGGGIDIQERPNTEFELAVDLLLLAMGFTGPETHHLVEQLGVDLDPRGNVKSDGQYCTSVPGVFVAGDAHRGASLIVWAIAEGREAARQIDSHLRAGAAPWLPTRGADAPFGGR